MPVQTGVSGLPIMGISLPGQSTFEDPHSGREIIDSSCCSESCCDDGGRGDEVVGKCIVQIALYFHVESSDFSPAWLQIWVRSC